MRDFEAWRRARGLKHLAKILAIPRFYVADTVQEINEGLQNVKYPPRYLQPIRESRVIAISLEDAVADISQTADFEYTVRIHDATGEINVLWPDYRGCFEYLEKLYEKLNLMRTTAEDFVISKVKENSYNASVLPPEEVIKTILRRSQSKRYREQIPWFANDEILENFIPHTDPSEGTFHYKEILLGKFRHLEQLLIIDASLDKSMGLRNILKKREEKSTLVRQLVPAY